MSQASRSKRSNKTRVIPTRRLSRLQIVSRIGILVAIVALLGVAGLMLLRSMNQRSDPTAVQFNLIVNPSLNPFEAAGLAAYMAMNEQALSTPYSADSTPVTFEVAQGQTGEQIADQLVAQGLIADAALFSNYLRYYGLDRGLEAGVYELSPAMTIPQIAVTLTHARPIELTVRIIEGWRREQIADHIDQQVDIPFTSADFLAASGVGIILPPGLQGVIPPGVTAEGFLFPDTYRLGQEATASELVQKMLENFDAKVTPQFRADAIETGYSLYQIVTLASIVEREAVVADERPSIASVYLNRLQSGQKLDADPTVQYAMGFQPDTGQWWNLNLTAADYHSVDSLYNTYLYPGLPPGPIASPGLDSILAVIYPAQTPYFYFRAACDGSGRHIFAVTFEEHINNACP